ncbi:uncharacterized protein TNCV_2510051 [Trichonephila clavipes]|nr:uncharacterized protein TNCV_2510051 [Trichonephila clavipes]
MKKAVSGWILTSHCSATRGLLAMDLVILNHGQVTGTTPSAHCINRHWAGHIVKVDEDRTRKKVFNAQPTGTRRKGRRNLRWVDGMEKDLLVLRIKNWRTLVGRGLAWKRLLEKAKAHPGLSSH